MRFSVIAALTALIVTGAACASGSPRAAPAAKPATGGAASQPAQPGLRPDYFAGKTITSLVNFSAGGPTDVFARLLSSHLERYVPGRPKIIVENKPGAGGAIGANQLYNASRKDGLTIGMFSSPFTQQIMGAEGVQYDSAGFLWLGGVSESSVSYMGATLGAKNTRELTQSRGEIVAGGLAPDSSKDLTLRTYLNMFGLKHRYVTGYPGQADINLAFRRGEVNYAEESLTSWVTNGAQFVKEGLAYTTSQRGILRGREAVRDPRVADVPTHLEVAVELKGDAVKQTPEYRAMTLIVQMSSMLRAIVYPPGTSSDVVEAMRQAVTSTFADPEFQAAAQQQLGFEFVFVPGAEAQDQAQLIITQSQQETEALDYLKRLAHEKS
jgi:tripartite-type tricarboxylate transporter receptor subunit TctC